MRNSYHVLLVLLALVSTSWALPYILIKKGDPEYAGVCPKSKGSKAVPSPDECNLTQYVSCFNGRPMCILRCLGDTPRFDGKKEQCVKETDVPLPPQCNGKLKDTEPKTCADAGAVRIANATTCRSYIYCLEGTEIPRACQPKYYFIDGQCRPTTLHYVHSLDKNELQRCKDLDIKYPPPQPEIS